MAQKFFYVFYMHHMVTDVFSHAEYKYGVRIALSPIVLKQVAKKSSKKVF